MEEVGSKINELVTLYGLNVLAAIVIFVVGKWVARWVSDVTAKLMTKAKVDAALVSFVQHLAYVALMVFVIIAAIGKLGVQTTSFIAVLGAAGLAVGLALQGSLSNFAAGVLIVLFKPFKAGDFIEAGGAMGTVKEIQIFCTILASPDNRKIIVPNSGIMGGNITNFSGNETRRVDMVFGISYGDDIPKAKKVLMQVVSSYPTVLKDPEPTIAVKELADSSVNFAVRPWVNGADYWGTWFGITEAVKMEFDKQGISIPFPQHDLHVKTSEMTFTGATGKEAVAR
ncbi:MAG: mechanosensitive ion channel [Candidatus Omnitrophica bacterium]|nr:mechanosensitive ion channel [Candidatus Omnitrophota bacterium]